jgi:hypothetical protein
VAVERERERERERRCCSDGVGGWAIQPKAQNPVQKVGGLATATQFRCGFEWRVSLSALAPCSSFFGCGSLATASGSSLTQRTRPRPHPRQSTRAELQWMEIASVCSTGRASDLLQSTGDAARDLQGGIGIWGRGATRFQFDSSAERLQPPLTSASRSFWAVPNQRPNTNARGEIQLEPRGLRRLTHRL